MTVFTDVRIHDGSTLSALNQATKPLGELNADRPVVTTFQVKLRCNSACGYSDLPLNVGRYEMSREEIQGVFSVLHRDGMGFVMAQGGEHRGAPLKDPFRLVRPAVPP